MYSFSLSPALKAAWLCLPGVGLPFPASELGLSCAGDTIDAQVSCRAWIPDSKAPV